MSVVMPAEESRPLPPLSASTDRAQADGGDLLLSPDSQSDRYASGMEILSPDGRKTVWSHPVPAGNGYSADGHEFLITSHHTALILAYGPCCSTPNSPRG